MDTSKQVFQLHGVSEAETPVLRKQLKRKDVLSFYGRLPATQVAIEACGASHYWARELTKLGHTVKMIAPQLSKPYVKRGKNDAADAEALCEAMSRPTMRFVPVKSAEQQAALMLAGERQRLVRQHTQLINTIRGYGAEFGLTAAKGVSHVVPLLKDLCADPTLPTLARTLFAEHANELKALDERIKKVDEQLLAWSKSNEMARRLAAVPTIGPVISAMLVMKTPDPEAFRSGRDYAAWIGLTPKDHSTAGKVRQGGITRAGDETLRSLLVVGATSVIAHTKRGYLKHPMPWLVTLLERKEPKLAAVALANKIARIAWKLMVSGQTYDRTRARPELAAGTAAVAAAA
jgi:transposase